jgi:hypothetical protein
LSETRLILAIFIQRLPISTPMLIVFWKVSASSNPVFGEGMAGSVELAVDGRGGAVADQIKQLFSGGDLVLSHQFNTPYR